MVPKLDFLSTFGEEFCEALSPPVPEDLIVPQDGYEVWLRAFGTHPSPEALAALTDTGLEKLRIASAGYFECPMVTTAQMRQFVSRVIARCSAQHPS